tara:strand:- start:990 stop:1409 length:420 start_codon:yes stop_codon:yes gene_type:complete
VLAEIKEYMPRIKWRAVNKIIALIIITLFIGGCGSHYYHDKVVSYVPGIIEILTSSNKCESSNKCPLVFVSGEAWVIGGKPFGGVNISVYKVFEPTVISKILTSIINNHQNHPEVKTTIKIYSSAHQADQEVLVAKLTL